ncbi:putative SAM-dependent methyltransferase [Cladorrhinum sp. PSN259]|nr:putative SAM-dependent methyltransferase [Cladorrhinum sp. PSN259]
MASPSSEAVLPLASASKIASYHTQPSTGATAVSQSIELSQAVHRINLINAFGPLAIHPGAQILELGCGQGTCTAVLAEAVSSSSSSSSSASSHAAGHVTGLDPASGDYGAPSTLSQAQTHLTTSSPSVPEYIRSSITFHLETDLFSFLSRPENATAHDKKWDTAVLAHCIFYFPNPQETLSSILGALKGRVKRVCIAEYALQSSHPGSFPHVLAALSRATLEAHKTESEENIQGIISPEGIKRIVRKAGWKLESEGTVVPEKELSDGYWETAGVVDESFVTEIEEGVRDERARSVLSASRDAVVNAVKGVGGVKDVRTMDVWVGTLVRDDDEEEEEAVGQK